MKRKSFTYMGIIFSIVLCFFITYSLMGAEKNISASSAKTTVESQPSAQQTETAEIPIVEIPKDKQTLIGVKTSPVEEILMKKVIRMTGRVEYDEQKLTTINAKVEGWIEKLHLDYTGRYVKKGEPLLEIYSPDLMAAQQELINLKSNTNQKSDDVLGAMITKDTNNLLEAARKRLKLWDVTDAQIRKIEQTGTPMRTISLLSPVSGTVVQKYAVQGMKVMAGERLFDLADLSRVWIISEVNESDIGLVHIGQKVLITFDSFPGKTFTAQIEYIYPSLNQETRTGRIRLSMPNTDGILKPQMYAIAILTIDLGKRLAVPEDAIIDTGQRKIVYVDKGDGNFEPREILSGMRAEGYREIIAGVKKGERVATSGTFLIDSEAQLRGITPLPVKAPQNTK